MNIDELFKKISEDRAAKAANPISYLVVGLGNPGKEYDGTRHNAGFAALDYISAARACRNSNSIRSWAKRILAALEYCL